MVRIRSDLSVHEAVRMARHHSNDEKCGDTVELTKSPGIFGVFCCHRPNWFELFVQIGRSLWKLGETRMKNGLIALLSATFVWVVYIVISTSLESNLFKEWDFLASIPWMRATLWDFYALILVLLLWVYYKESSIVLKGVWTVLFVGLGSIAVTAYVLLQIFRLKKGEGLHNVLLRK
ncbi:MAG: DUF1475 domain-containing protein [Bacteroidetes bacterium]|nr:MAG: DUF1475 domain-containing protein [Bacteroidota bacterium]